MNARPLLRKLPAKREALAVPGSFVTMFLMGATVSLLGPSLPDIARRTGVTLGETGILFTLFGAGSLAATLLMAGLVNRPARRLLLIGGSAMLAGMLWLAAGATTLGWLGAALALAGFGMSTACIAPNVILIEVYRSRAPSALNALHMVAGIGAFLSPLAIGFIGQRGGDYRAVFLVLAALEGLVAILWATARLPGPRVEVAAPALPLAALRPLLIFLVLALLYDGCEQAFGAWLFAYARQPGALDVAAAGATASLFWLAMIAGRLLATQTLRRAGTLALLVASVCLGGAGVAFVALAGPRHDLLWAATALTGLAFGPIFPTTLAAGAQVMPERAGISSSLLIASASAGTMILPWATGTLIPTLGVTASIAAVDAPLALMLACLAILHLRSRSAKCAPGGNKK